MPWLCCLTVGLQSALSRPRHRLSGGAGAAFISTLGGPVVNPAAFCGWAVRYDIPESLSSSGKPRLKACRGREGELLVLMGHLPWTS